LESSTGTPVVRRAIGSLRFSPEGANFLYRREAQRGVSNHLYWPGGSSGVTLGPGYDMKERSHAAVVGDLVRIGLTRATAEKAAAGARLSGSKAEDFADDNDDLVSLSSHQETQLLRLAVKEKEPIVRRHLIVQLAQYEFDALVSFVYNPGGSFLPVAHAINQGKVTHAMHVIGSRVHSGARFSPGLADRRRREVQLFLHGLYQDHTRRAAKP
jgi:hypothetical protein